VTIAARVQFGQLLDVFDQKPVASKDTNRDDFVDFRPGSSSDATKVHRFVGA